MGGFNSVPMAVQCIPERVLGLISHYAEDLEFGSVEDFPIKLRESSRRASVVPCVLWRKHMDERLTAFVVDRCRIVRARGYKNTKFIISNSGGVGCMLSNKWANSCFHFRVSGDECAWIWKRCDGLGWIARGQEPSLSSFDALNCVLALNSKYLLGISFTNDSIHNTVMEIESPTLRTTWIEVPQPPGFRFPFANPPSQMAIAAAFLDDHTKDYLYASRGFELFSVDFQTNTKQLLFGLEQSRNAVEYQVRSWGSSIHREDSSFVFGFCALLEKPSPCCEGPFLYARLMRFAILPNKKLRFMAFWRSHTLSPTCLALRLRNRKHCPFDIAPSGSSVLACQYEGRLLTFDNRTLKGKRWGLNLNANRRKMDQSIFRYPRVLSRFTKNKSVEVIIQGIRNSKEKRIRSLQGFCDSSEV